MYMYVIGFFCMIYKNPIIYKYMIKKSYHKYINICLFIIDEIKLILSEFSSSPNSLTARLAILVLRVLSEAIGFYREIHDVKIFSKIFTLFLFDRKIIDICIQMSVKMHGMIYVIYLYVIYDI